MKLYNSLTRKVEVLKYGPGERVTLFVCGPTVYDLSHIGHGRTYVVYDALVKYLRGELGWNVFYLQNITDINDKIDTRASKEGQDPVELAKEMEKEYYRDMKAIGVTAVDEYAPASEYIAEIVSQVERLIKKGHVYKIDDDGYYFDVTTFKDYGKLAGRTVEQAEDGITRIDESIKKKNKADFVVWKLHEEGSASPSWETSLGKGRPGWHIEDTAIAEKHFSFTYDLHGAGIDLIFPHHEAEIAQMEALSGISPMVKVWTHVGALTVEGTKMSKSLGNFVTIREFLQNHSAQMLRMYLFSAHYRSPVDYTPGVVAEAEARQERLQEFMHRLQEVTTEGVSPFPLTEFTDAFWKALSDDFNTPKALAELFQLVTETNKLIDAHTLSKADAQSLLAFLGGVNAIFNILVDTEPNVPEDIASLMARREEARTEGRYEDADALREVVRKKGFDIKDTPDGPRVVQS